MLSAREELVGRKSLKKKNLNFIEKIRTCLTVSATTFDRRLGSIRKIIKISYCYLLKIFAIQGDLSYTKKELTP